MKFACFCIISNFPYSHGILLNLTMAGENGTNKTYYGRVQAAAESGRILITTCRHDCAMKYMTGTPALMGGILTILNLCEILPVYFIDRWQICLLRLLATNTAYLVIEN